ncbi:MAG: XdhC family protein [Rhodospirillaceae bacterium]|nr:XdhC family protein [Rhodospirillaceae bacterium]
MTPPTTLDPLDQLAAWARDGRGVALATVAATWGSSPRPVGSHMAVADNGEFAGSVSGGCIEGAVVEAARAAIASGKPQMLEYGVTNEAAWEVGLACGGRIQVFVQPKPVVLEELQAARAAHRLCAVVTDTHSGAQLLVDGDTLSGDLCLSDDEVMEARGRIAADKSGIAPYGHLVRVYAPEPRMVIVGAVHIAQALAPMAKIAGFAVTVIDPREGFAKSGALAGIDAIVAWPDEAMAGIEPDARTAVVTLTHDPKLDDPALAAALKSEAFYIGALGSRKTHAKRLERLAEAGFTGDDIARIHGPVGLDINALTPAEIAVSILAQVVAALRREL